eukprot:CAMPEP_0176430154 /NCGR_PEP_ID=MMETSP0127-20121128/14093_1 /TAXON_ID=938130 /ORGANISM="Platyophrya macrostoma, Strain WH" /LENGTH=50 /DNA_ID=CAMNT_0017812007 /DNA_START=541 /DNA_END=693 /DNA_ORIENTATION=-
MVGFAFSPYPPGPGPNVGGWKKRSIDPAKEAEGRASPVLGTGGLGIIGPV